MLITRNLLFLVQDISEVINEKHEQRILRIRTNEYFFKDKNADEKQCDEWKFQHISNEAGFKKDEKSWSEEKRNVQVKIL